MQTFPRPLPLGGQVDDHGDLVLLKRFPRQLPTDYAHDPIQLCGIGLLAGAARAGEIGIVVGRGRVGIHRSTGRALATIV